MAPLNKAAAPALRAWTRHTLPSTVRPTTALKPAATTSTVLSSQRRNAASDGGPRDRPIYEGSAVYDDPFHRSGGTARETTKVPDFGKYKSGRDEITNRVFQYFMVGTMGALTAMGAKATVQGEFDLSMALAFQALCRGGKANGLLCGRLPRRKLD